MNLNSLRPSSRAPISIGLLLAGVCAQSATSLPGQVSATPSASEAAAPTNDGQIVGLPLFLLLVPGGTVEVGMTSEALLGATAQVLSPTRPTPAIAAKMSAEKFSATLKRTASALGRRKINVEPFFLAKWPVKCIEYESILLACRQQGMKVRCPFHWWRYGRADHYNSVLPDIAQQFPKDVLGPLLYWERHGADLPYELKDEKGASIAEHPVTNVDYREANAFAAAMGMRLPTEAEFTRAARGDGTNVWPWGKDAPATDVFTEDALKQLRIFNSRDQALKPVGTVAAGTGPFGHVDMFGQVWQLVAGLGYRPINGADLFAAEWKSLQNDKVGALLQAAPTWKDDHVMGKGGSFLSAGDPIQLLVDARADVQTIDVLDGLGFRLAKSLKPGYDMLFSLLRGTYNRGPFGTDQDIDLTAQIGAERYDLGPTGFPTAYHAVTFAPVDGLTNDKAVELPKMLDKSHASPILLGTFATTMALLDPAVPAGHYSVLYRKEGMPRELQDAIKAGHKELAGAKKAKPKADGPAEGEESDQPKEGKGKGGKDKEQDKKGSWRDILARFGLTERDIEGKEAADGLKFVRIDGLEISTERDCFLLHGTEGKVIAAIPATNKKLAYSNAFAPKLVLEANDKGKMVAKFRVAAPLQAQNPKKVVEIHFQVTLDRAMPDADTPWRLPVH